MSIKLKIIDINYFLCFLISVWMIFPAYYKNSSNLYVFVITVLWILTALMHAFSVKAEKFLFFLALWIMYISSYEIFGLSEIKIINFIKQLFFWLPQFMFLFYRDNGDKIRNRRLISWILIASFVSIVWNVYLLIIYPDASVAINFEYGEKYQAYNIGTTAYSFYAAIMIIICVCLISESSFLKKWKKVLCIGLIIVSAVLCIQMGRAITLIVLAGGLYLSFYLNKSYKKGTVYKIGYFLLFLLPILLVLSFFNEMVVALESMFGHTRIIDRLMELGNMFFHANNRALQSGALRISLYSVSIYSWLSSVKSFLFGIGYPDMDKSNSFYYIGGHSEIFDIFGAYGVVGAIIFIVLMTSFFKYVYKGTSGTKKYFSIVIFVMCFMYAILSGLSNSPVLGLGLFLIAPLVICDYTEENDDVGVI